MQRAEQPTEGVAPGSAAYCALLPQRNSKTDFPHPLPCCRQDIHTVLGRRGGCGTCSPQAAGPRQGWQWQLVARLGELLRLGSLHAMQSLPTAGIAKLSLSNKNRALILSGVCGRTAARAGGALLAALHYSGHAMSKVKAFTPCLCS